MGESSCFASSDQDRIELVPLLGPLELAVSLETFHLLSGLSRRAMSKEGSFLADGQSFSWLLPVFNCLVFLQLVQLLGLSG